MGQKGLKTGGPQPSDLTCDHASVAALRSLRFGRCASVAALRSLRFGRCALTCDHGLTCDHALTCGHGLTWGKEGKVRKTVGFLI